MCFGSVIAATYQVELEAWFESVLFEKRGVSCLVGIFPQSASDDVRNTVTKARCPGRFSQSDRVSDLYVWNLFSKRIVCFKSVARTSGLETDGTNQRGVVHACVESHKRSVVRDVGFGHDHSQRNTTPT